MYGKDPNALAGMPTCGASLTQQLTTSGAQAPRTPYNNYWADSYRPPEHSPDIIRLIPGSYLQQEIGADGLSVDVTTPFIRYTEHHNGHAGCICSAGVHANSKDKALPCPSCAIFWEDRAIQNVKKANGDRQRGPTRMSRTEKFAFNVWDYGLYYYTPQVSKKTGLPYKNSKGEQQFTWEKGVLNDPLRMGQAFKYGHLLPWPMGKTFKDTLNTYAKLVSNSCKSCGGRDTIVTMAKYCGNPEVGPDGTLACGTMVYDAQNTTLTPEQRAQIDYQRHTCTRCGYTGFVVEQISCKNCSNASRASLFDVDLQVLRIVPPGAQQEDNIYGSKRGGVPFLQIINWSEPRQLQAPAEVIATIQPLDLLKKYAPTLPDRQNQVMNITGMQQKLAQPPVSTTPMTSTMPVVAPPGMQWGQQPVQQMQPMPQPQAMQAGPAMPSMATPSFPTMGQPMNLPAGMPAIPYTK